MAFNVITAPVALSIIRRLSGTDGYPFHLEGEVRAADVLIEGCSSVECAYAVVDDFEGDTFPFIESLRRKCRDMMEACRLCNGFRWQHQNPQHQCRGFLSKPEDGWDKPYTAEETAELERKYGAADQEWSRNMVVQARTLSAGGADWDDFNLQCIRQAIWRDQNPKAGSTKEAQDSRDFWRAAVMRYESEYPETVAAIREGRPVEAPKTRKKPAETETGPLTQADIDAVIAQSKGA